MYKTSLIIFADPAVLFFKRLLRLGAVCLFFIVSFASISEVALGQERASLLYQEFDARPFDVNEKRLLQLGLALTEDYLGLLDGKWGKRSQDALEQFTDREFNREPLNLHVAAVVLNAAGIVATQGWQIRYIRPLNISILFPEKSAVEGTPTGSFENWNDTETSVSYSFARSTTSKMLDFHRFVRSQNVSTYTIYSVVKKTLIVSAVKTDEGQKIYARSDKIGKVWTTVIISADKADFGLLNAVSSSIKVGAGKEIFLPANGYLDRIIELFVEIAKEDTTPPNTPKTNAPVRAGRGHIVSSGTGFIVSKEGHILTNAHVVSGCSRVYVDGKSATVQAISDIFDLAIVHSYSHSDSDAAVFADRPAALNTHVTASGFPYSSFLAGLNVTQGSVSSLQGLRGENFQLQISAPVQPGNSGGPLINDFGEIVGVVVAKLSKKYTERLTGSFAENINFAVRGEVAKLFLAQNGMEIEIGQSRIRKPPEDIGKIASNITVLIECE